MDKRLKLYFILAIAISNSAIASSGEGRNGLYVEALNHLFDNRGSIVYEAKKHAANAPPPLRSESRKIPILQSIGEIQLNMSEEDVAKLMGAPDVKKDSFDGRKWSYLEDQNETIIIAFDDVGHVEQIFSSSKKINIPVELSINQLLGEFEAIYGSRRFRSTTTLTPELKLVKYPFSNLALVVNSNTNLVHSIMVYRA